MRGGSTRDPGRFSRSVFGTKLTSGSDGSIAENLATRHVDGLGQAVVGEEAQGEKPLECRRLGGKARGQKARAAPIQHLEVGLLAGREAAGGRAEAERPRAAE